MREIKFRAWHEKLNRMVYGISVCNATADWADENGKSWIFEENIMQYTGLKDKNGTEIYEGDIVKTQNDFIREIVFKDSAFHVVGENNGEKVSHPLYFQCVLRKDGMIDFEVIGNIYDV